MAKPSRTKRPDPKRLALAGFGGRVQRYRKEAGRTQAELAEKLDLSVAYVSLIERGGRNPPYTTVIAIAKALGVPAAMLVE